MQIAEHIGNSLPNLDAMVRRVTDKSLDEWDALWLERRRRLHAGEMQEWRWVAAVIGPRDIRELRRHSFTPTQVTQWANRYGAADEFAAREVDVSLRGIYCPKTDKQIKVVIGCFLNWED